MMKFLNVVLILTLLSTLLNLVGDNRQSKQIEQMQLKIEELDEHIFILQGRDYNETY